MFFTRCERLFEATELFTCLLLYQSSFVIELPSVCCQYFISIFTSTNWPVPLTVNYRHVSIDECRVRQLESPPEYFSISLLDQYTYSEKLKKGDFRKKNVLPTWETHYICKWDGNLSGLKDIEKRDMLRQKGMCKNLQNFRIDCVVIITLTLPRTTDFIVHTFNKVINSSQWRTTKSNYLKIVVHSSNLSNNIQLLNIYVFSSFRFMFKSFSSLVKKI